MIYQIFMTQIELYFGSYWYLRKEKCIYFIQMLKLEIMGKKNFWASKTYLIAVERMQKLSIYKSLNVDMLYVAYWEKVLSSTDGGKTKLDAIWAAVEKLS